MPSRMWLPRLRSKRSISPSSMRSRLKYRQSRACRARKPFFGRLLERGSGLIAFPPRYRLGHHLRWDVVEERAHHVEPAVGRPAITLVLLALGLRVAGIGPPVTPATHWA